MKGSKNESTTTNMKKSFTEKKVLCIKTSITLQSKYYMSKRQKVLYI